MINYLTTVGGGHDNVGELPKYKWNIIEVSDIIADNSNEEPYVTSNKLASDTEEIILSNLWDAGYNVEHTGTTQRPSYRLIGRKNLQGPYSVKAVPGQNCLFNGPAWYVGDTYAYYIPAQEVVPYWDGDRYWIYRILCSKKYRLYGKDRTIGGAGGYYTVESWVNPCNFSPLKRDLDSTSRIYEIDENDNRTLDIYYKTDESNPEYGHPVFNNLNLIGGISYRKEINSNKDLDVGDVATASIVFTSTQKVNVNDGVVWSYHQRKEEDGVYDYIEEDDDEWWNIGNFYLTECKKVGDDRYQYTGYDALYKADASSDKYMELASNAVNSNYLWDYYTCDLDSAESGSITLRENEKYYIDSEIVFKDIDDIRMKNPKYTIVSPYTIQGIDINHNVGYLTNDVGTVSGVGMWIPHDKTMGVNIGAVYDMSGLDRDYMMRYKVYKLKRASRIVGFSGLGISGTRFTNWISEYGLKYIKFNDEVNKLNKESGIEGVTDHPIDTSKLYYVASDSVAYIYTDWATVGDISYDYVCLTNITECAARPATLNIKRWSQTLPVIETDHEYDYDVIENDYVGSFIWPTQDSQPYYLTARTSVTSNLMTFTTKKLEMHYAGRLFSPNKDAYPEDEGFEEDDTYKYYKLVAIPKVTTLGDLYESICNYIGIPYTVPNAVSAWDFDLQNNFQATGKTFKDLLSYIAQFVGGFIHVPNTGNVTLDWFKEKEVYLTNNEYVTFTKADYSTPDINRIQITNSNDVDYLSYGFGDNILYIKDNPLFLVEDVSSLYEYLGDLYEKVNGYPEYYPSTINLLRNTDLECGDIVTLVDESNMIQFSTMIFSKSFDNSGVILECTGNPEREVLRTSQYKTKNNVNGAYSETEENTKVVSFEVGNDVDEEYRKLSIAQNGIFIEDESGESRTIPSMSWDDATSTLTIVG